MNELYATIVALYRQDKAAPLRALIAKPPQDKPDYIGLYRNCAPPGAGYPLITMSMPQEGDTRISACPTPETTDEVVPFQFSIFADDETTCGKIAHELRRVFDNYTGPLAPFEAPPGVIRDTTRRGPGRLAKDPDKGYDGFVLFTFTVRLNS
jgi:hypothetical protein